MEKESFNDFTNSLIRSLTKREDRKTSFNSMIVGITSIIDEDIFFSFTNEDKDSFLNHFIQKYVHKLLSLDKMTNPEITEIIDFICHLSLLFFRGILKNISQFMNPLATMIDKNTKFWISYPQFYLNFYLNCYTTDILMNLFSKIQANQDIQLYHIDALLLIIKDHYQILEVFKQIYSMLASIDDKKLKDIEGSTFSRIFNFVLLYLPNLDDETIVKMYLFQLLDVSVNALMSQLIDKQLFVAQFWKTASQHELFPEWVAEANPFNVIKHITAHDTVLLDLQESIPIIYQNSQLVYDDFAFLLDRVTKADSSQQYLFAQFLGLAFENSDQDAVLDFIVPMVESSLDELLPFLGPILISLIRSEQDAGSILFNSLFDRIPNDSNDKILKLLINTAEQSIEVRKAVVEICAHEILSGSTERHPVTLLTSIIPYFTLIEGDDLLSKFVDNIHSKNTKTVPNSYVEIWKVLLYKIRLPMSTLKGRVITQKLVTVDGGWEILCNLYGKYGKTLFSEELWQEIWRILLPYLNEIALKDFYCPILQMASHRMSGQAVSYLNLHYSDIAFYVFENTVMYYLSVSDDGLLNSIFESAMILYRLIYEDQKSYILDAIINEFINRLNKEGSFKEKTRILKFSYKFIIDYEGLLDPVNDMNLNRHCSDYHHDGFPMHFVLPNQRKITLKVNNKTKIVNIQCALAAKLKTFYDVLFIMENGYYLDPSFTVGDYKIEPNRTFNIRLTQVIKVNAIVCPTQLLKNPKMHNYLLKCLIFQKDEKLIKYSWKLLMVLPTYNLLFRELYNDYSSINSIILKDCPYYLKYLLQILYIIIDSYRSIDYAFEVSSLLLHNLVINNFKIMHIYDVLRIVSHPILNETLEYDEKIVYCLIQYYNMESENGNDFKAKEAIFSFLQTYCNHFPQTEQIILNSNEFVKSSIFNEVPKSIINDFYINFQNKEEVFLLLTEWFDDAFVDDNNTKKYFFILTNLLNEDSTIDPTVVFSQSAEKLPSLKYPLFSYVGNFVKTYIFINEDLLVNSEYLIESLIPIFLHDSTNLLQKPIVDILKIINSQSPDAAAKTNELLSDALNFKTERWCYNPENFRKRPAGVCGLRNLGATCYMCSVLQQLFYNPTFRSNLFKATFDEPLVNALRSLFIDLAFSEQSFCNTEQFANVWSNEDGITFKTRVQEDATEFLQLLLTHLPHCLTDSFSGTFKTVIQGIGNSFFRELVEPFFTLELPIAGFNSFDESMTSLFLPSLFTGANQYTNDQKQKIDAKRISTVTKLPDILIIQLKRFDYDVKTYRKTKLFDSFVFPESFNASKYFSGQEGDYQLRGVVVHAGNAEGGHFNSIVKLDNEWVSFDDTEPEIISNAIYNSYAFGRPKEQEIVGEPSQDPNNNRCAYLLFYERDKNPYSLDEIKSSMELIIDPQAMIEMAEKNESFELMQSIFSSNMADLMQSVDDIDLLIKYFINIFCHTELTQMIPSLLYKIIHLLTVNDGAKVIARYLTENNADMIRILLDASEEFSRALISLIENIIVMLPIEDILPVVASIVNNLEQALPSWRTIPQFGRVLWSFVNVDDAHAIVAAENSWGNNIINMMNIFYMQTTGNVASENVDFSDLLSIVSVLIGLQPELDIQFKEFIENYSSKLILSERNKTIVFPIIQKYCGKESIKQEMTMETFIRLLCTCQTYENIVEFMKSSGKSASYLKNIVVWNYSNNSLLQHLISFPRSILFYLLTCDEEDICKSIFDMYTQICGIKLLLKYDYAENYGKGHRYITPFTDKINIMIQGSKESLEYIIMELMDEARNHIFDLQGRLYNLFRFNGLMRRILKNTELGNIDEIIFMVSSTELDPNLDLIECFQMLVSVDKFSLLESFSNKFDQWMSVICPDRKPSEITDAPVRLNFVAYLLFNIMRRDYPLLKRFFNDNRLSVALNSYLQINETTSQYFWNMLKEVCVIPEMKHTIIKFLLKSLPNALTNDMYSKWYFYILSLVTQEFDEEDSMTLFTQFCMKFMIAFKDLDVLEFTKRVFSIHPVVPSNEFFSKFVQRLFVSNDKTFINFIDFAATESPEFANKMSEHLYNMIEERVSMVDTEIFWKNMFLLCCCVLRIPDDSISSKFFESIVNNYIMKNTEIITDLYPTYCVQVLSYAAKTKESELHYNWISFLFNALILRNKSNDIIDNFIKIATEKIKDEDFYFAFETLVYNINQSVNESTQYIKFLSDILNVRPDLKIAMKDVFNFDEQAIAEWPNQIIRYDTLFNSG